MIETRGTLYLIFGWTVVDNVAFVQSRANTSSCAASLSYLYNNGKRTESIAEFDAVVSESISYV